MFYGSFVERTVPLLLHLGYRSGPLIHDRYIGCPTYLIKYSSMHLIDNRLQLHKVSERFVFDALDNQLT